jgi:hypothetical protein
MGADAWNLPNTAASCVAAGDLFEPIGQFVDLPLDCLPLLPQHADQVAHHRRQCVVCVLENICHVGL